MKQKIQFLIVSMLFLLATPAALTAYGQPVLTFAADSWRPAEGETPVDAGREGRS